MADRTENYSPADLQAIINDAQLEGVHVVLEAEKDKMLEAGADAESPDVSTQTRKEAACPRLSFCCCCRCRWL